MELMKDPETLTPEECAGVCIVAEQRAGALSSVTYELAGAGRRLADALGEPLCAVLFGSGVDALADELDEQQPVGRAGLGAGVVQAQAGLDVASELRQHALHGRRVLQADRSRRHWTRTSPRP